MLTSEILTTMVATTDALAVIALATLAFCLAQGTASRSAAFKAGIPALGLLLWGSAWTWLPSLAAWRLGPVTSGAQSAVPTLALIVATAVALSTLALTGAGQAFFARADRRTLLSLGSWRTVFGAGLLMIGLAGGLPPEFYWSAGLGDIVVGVVSTGLLAKGRDVTDRQFIGWNVLGLADLLHVISLAAIYVAPFFIANPALPPLNLVPLIIVPTFIALHIGVLVHAARMSRATRQQAA